MGLFKTKNTSEEDREREKLNWQERCRKRALEEIAEFNRAAHWTRESWLIYEPDEDEEFSPDPRTGEQLPFITVWYHHRQSRHPGMNVNLFDYLCKELMDDSYLPGPATEDGQTFYKVGSMVIMRPKQKDG